ncbi:unnamed protein product [Adineta steineri]|uniref:catechol O-methyltransferase n=2 Tax=Adineta steineri TaxID=433720 RepID=A0A818P057_9BILA|nr:unnamed protein product [Adineta steineri]CAF1296454.1 unnamed protein product [Adineta steineri]CAF3615607.1 unnamed protein product [Adineta steineri]CAF4105648.1 unnamed protein product [Adineta steineri]
MLDSRSQLQDYVQHNSNRGDIQNIIDTIDKFGWTEQRLINIGDQKGKILDEAIQTRKPKTILELGTFLGYSALRMIRLLPKDALLISVDCDSESAEIARSIFEYAGVTDRIKTIVDYTNNVIPHLNKDFNVDSFDLIFIDHFKDVYLRDFKMLEDAGLIKSGTMIVADNVIHPGAPDYLEYVQNNPNYSTTLHESKLEYTDNVRDAIAISIRK